MGRWSETDGCQETSQRGRRQHQRGQVGDKCLYCSIAGRGGWLWNGMKGKKKQVLTWNTMQQRWDSILVWFKIVFARLTSLRNLICVKREFLCVVSVCLYLHPIAILMVLSWALPSRSNKPWQGKHSLMCLPRLLPPMPSEQTTLSLWRLCGREGHLGLSTRSLSALLVHPVVNKGNPLMMFLLPSSLGYVYGVFSSVGVPPTAVNVNAIQGKPLLIFLLFKRPPHLEQIQACLLHLIQLN